MNREHDRKQRPGDYEGPGRKESVRHKEEYGAEIQTYAGEWTLIEEAECWCLEGVVYCASPCAADLQSLNLFVPKAYLAPDGSVLKDGSCGAYRAEDAPVVLQSSVMGYSEAPAAVWMPHSGKPDQVMMARMLRAGMVFVSVGVRGRQTRSGQGRYIGKSPAYLVDVKAAIRYLRHNRAMLPGDMDRMFFVGVSAGGNLAALVGTTGNSACFDPYLRGIGACMEEKDDVLGSCIFCPITDLEHSDMSYEWMFPQHNAGEAPAGADAVLARPDSGMCENDETDASQTGMENGVETVSGAVSEDESMDAFRAACSEILARNYISWFNRLDLHDPADGRLLRLHDSSEEQKGSLEAYLVKKLEDSASRYLNRIGTDPAMTAASPADYLSGNYEENAGGPGGRGRKVPGIDKRKWLSWDGSHAHITSLRGMEGEYLKRFKDCPSFDGLDMEYFENEEFGTEDEERAHFDGTFSDVLEELKETFPETCARYTRPYRDAAADARIREQVRLLNPLYFIRENPEDTLCEHYRIRVGSRDPHTSFSTAAVLALSLQEKGKDVDFEFSWEQGHGLCDDGGLIEWIQRINGEEQVRRQSVR